MKMVLVLLSLSVLLSNSLYSAITIYTDRTAWRNAATGSQIFYVDFNSYNSDIAATAPVDAGPFTLTPNGSWYMPLLDSAQGGFNNRSVDGTTGVTMQALSGVSLSVSFDQAIGSFGFDMADGFGGSRMATLTTSAGDSHNFNANSGTIGFIGLVSSSAITSVAFTSTSNVRPQLDNFEAYSFSGVPEPSAGAMLMLGLGGVFALRRFRRKAD